ncbi:MAG: HAD family phosphatase [Candidatus Obscuribacterales bacterium]|jgi:HAD superfamily hydrolase (TIGR01509 family)|nr:HAD family phosphatase [Candidatus Obscuribacterales bacterium]
MKAVIFDVDGTLVDSVDLHAEAWRQAFAKYGKNINFQAARDQIGKGGNELMPHFFGKKELEQFGSEMKEFRAKLFKDKFIDKVKPFPEVRELLLRIKKEGKKIAVGSSAHKDELEHYLKIADIKDLVDITTSADDIERAKPHPDVFQFILRKLDLLPGDTIVVGDSPYDAEAAGKAQIQTIGVRCGGFDENTLYEAGVIAIYDSPADILRQYQSALQRR